MTPTPTIRCRRADHPRPSDAAPRTSPAGTERCTCQAQRAESARQDLGALIRLIRTTQARPLPAPGPAVVVGMADPAPATGR